MEIDSSDSEENSLKQTTSKNLNNDQILWDTNKLV